MEKPPIWSYQDDRQRRTVEIGLNYVDWISFDLAHH